MPEMLTMAWRGTDSDDRLWYSTFNGKKWTPQQPAEPNATFAITSGFGPALAMDGPTVFMAWAGYNYKFEITGMQTGPVGPSGTPQTTPIWGWGRHPALRWASFVPSGDPPTLHFVDGNPSHVSSLIPQASLTDASGRSPHLALFQNHVYMAWKGSDSDKNIYWTNDFLWDHVNKQVGTSNGPAIAAFQSASDSQQLLYMVWRGADNDQNLWWATFDGKNWTGQKPIHGEGTSNDPALAVFHGELYLVWNGVAHDSAIYWTKFDGRKQQWSPRKPLPGGGVVPGVGTDQSPALAIYQDKLYMTWKGVGADKHIWWSNFDGASWAQQEITDNSFGTTSGPPAIVA